MRCLAIRLVASTPTSFKRARESRLRVVPLAGSICTTCTLPHILTPAVATSSCWVSRRARFRSWGVEDSPVAQIITLGASLLHMRASYLRTTFASTVYSMARHLRIQYARKPRSRPGRPTATLWLAPFPGTTATCTPASIIRLRLLPLLNIRLQFMPHSRSRCAPCLSLCNTNTTTAVAAMTSALPPSRSRRRTKCSPYQRLPRPRLRRRYVTLHPSRTRPRSR